MSINCFCNIISWSWKSEHRCTSHSSSNNRYRPPAQPPTTKDRNGSWNRCSSVRWIRRISSVENCSMWVMIDRSMQERCLFHVLRLVETTVLVQPIDGRRQWSETSTTGKQINGFVLNDLSLFRPRWSLWNRCWNSSTITTRCSHWHSWKKKWVNACLTASPSLLSSVSTKENDLQKYHVRRVDWHSVSEHRSVRMRGDSHPHTSLSLSFVQNLDRRWFLRAEHGTVQLYSRVFLAVCEILHCSSSPCATWCLPWLQTSRTTMDNRSTFSVSLNLWRHDLFLASSWIWMITIISITFSFQVDERILSEAVVSSMLFVSQLRTTVYWSALISRRNCTRKQSITFTMNSAQLLNWRISSKIMQQHWQVPLEKERSIVPIRFVFVLESPDLCSMAEISSFKFFSCNLHYGPNFTFSVRLDSLCSLDRRSSVWFQVTMSYNQKYSVQQESNFENRLDLRFTTINYRFLSTAHQLLNRKLTLFFAKTRSLKQFVRVRKIKNVVDDRETRSSFLSCYTWHRFRSRRSHGFTVSISRLLWWIRFVAFLAEDHLDRRTSSLLGWFASIDDYVHSVHWVSMATALWSNICIGHPNLWTQSHSRTRWIFQCTFKWTPVRTDNHPWTQSNLFEQREKPSRWTLSLLVGISCRICWWSRIDLWIPSDH